MNRLLPLATLLALLSLLPFLGHHVAQGAHPLAHGLDRIGLALHRAGHVAVTQGLFGILHRAPGLVQLASRGVALG